MDIEQRVQRLEMIAMNQVLIIDQLSRLIRLVAPHDALEDALEDSAEEMLALIYRHGVPVQELALAEDWRSTMERRKVMLTS